MLTKNLNKRLEKAYSFITNEEDARVCKDISDDACSYVPVNFFLIILSNTLTKIGDALSNPKTVLTWLMSYVNAPLFLISFLVPIRESGSMIPQILIAGVVRRLPKRKWVWVLGSILQFLSVMGIGLIALYFKGAAAGWLIIIALIIFSLSRGLNSIASKDVLGKTIPKTRRGKLGGYTASISGVITLFVGLFMILRDSAAFNVDFYSGLIFSAGLTWLLAAAVYSLVKEVPGETTGVGNAFKEAIKSLSLLKDDKPFRNFVITRSLLLCSALTAPFYVVLAQNRFDDQAYLLGLFIIVSALASSISAPIWGNKADVSSKRVMTTAAMITALLGVVMYLIIVEVPFLREQSWIYPAAFFVLGIAHSGVRLGRKTYIVDLAKGDRRTDYVAVSNTLIGIILLITGGITALLSVVSPEFVILILSLFGFAGAYMSLKLPEVD